MAAQNTTPAKSTRKPKGKAAPVKPENVEIVSDTPTTAQGDGEFDPSIVALLKDIESVNDGPSDTGQQEPTDEEIAIAIAAAGAVDLSLDNAAQTAAPEIHEQPENPKGKGKGKGKKTEKAAGDTEPPADKPKRVFYGNDKVRRLNDKLGNSVGEFVVLTLDDAGLDEDALKAKVTETFALIKDMNSKKANRATNLIEFIAGKRGSINPVLKRVLTLLSKNGMITMGVQGNVLTDLVNNPAPGERGYTIAAARAMAGNTVSMFEDLKLIVPSATTRHAFVSNPDSLLLLKANQLLGLQLGVAPSA
jgi:hypothetical protein